MNKNDTPHKQQLRNSDNHAIIHEYAFALHMYEAYMHDDRDSLHHTIAELHTRIAELERSLAQQTEQYALLQAVIDQLPYAIYWKDPELVYRGCNARFALDLGLVSAADVIGHTDADLGWKEAEVALFQAIDRRIIATHTAEYDDQETVVHADGTREWFETHKVPLIDSHGTVFGVLATYNNITARKQAEATVLAQASLLQDLSTPVIPLTESVLVVPLIGAIDSRRAQLLTATILERLTEARAETVLLDITGVPIIDTQVAYALVQTGRAVQLLGARMILTGIRPEVASALVGLGVDLGVVTTYSSLERALATVL